MRVLLLPVALAAACALVSGCAATSRTVGSTSTSSPSAGPAASSSAPATTDYHSSRVAVPTTATSIPAGRVAYGDSVMLGSKRLLQGRGFTVDAKVGRQFGASYNAIVKLRQRHVLPRNIVIHLGTNGTISVRDCRAVVDAAGPDRRVFLVNVRVPRPWMRGNNVHLATCAAAYPTGRVIVINWAAASNPHREWFGPDNIHPDAAGRTAYTALIDATLDQRGY
jgi:hypothetical protein